MNNGLDCSNSSNGSMENVERPKAPTCRPEKRVVSPTKEPQENQVCVSHDPGSVRKVPPNLGLNIIPADALPVSSGFIRAV